MSKHATLKFLVFSFIFSIYSFTPQFLNSQIEFKLTLMPDSEHWGVYARPADNITPSSELLTGSGQVTIVVDSEYEFGDVKSFHGDWIQNVRVSSPSENPGMDYISFGFISNVPPVMLSQDKETLLFTIKRVSSHPQDMHLIEKDDPFCIFPNSVRTNPGNELSIMDFGNDSTIYDWVGNYDDSETISAMPEYREEFASEK